MSKSSKSTMPYKVAMIIAYVFAVLALILGLALIKSVTGPAIFLIIMAVIIFLSGRSCAKRIKASRKNEEKPTESKDAPKYKVTYTPPTDDDETSASPVSMSLRNFRSFPMRVVGVTFNNDDGTSRQEIIAGLSEGDDIELEPYEYNGAPAVYVLADGEVIGNIPKEHTEEITNRIEAGEIVGVSVKNIRGGDGQNYGVVIEIDVAE